MNLKTNIEDGKTNILPSSVSRNAIELSGITKRFGSVIANNNVDIEVRKSTIHGIVGENGAGKSTLMSILFGLYQSDSGKILVNKSEVQINSSQKAISLGIGMVHQHFMLVPTFTVLENVILGNEGGMLLSSNHQKAKQQLIDLSNNYSLEIDPDALIQDIPVGMQQRVEILKSLSRGANILVLDEPTGVLTPQETISLFSILDSLKNQGVTIILITHKLREIMAITDNVSVMRGGKMVAHLETKKTNTEEIAELMVGRKVLFSLNKQELKPGNIILEAKNINLCRDNGSKVLDDISFSVRSGEIVGIAGVSGNGQSELLDILAGINNLESGQLIIDGKEINQENHINPNEIRKLGISHVPEDRHSRGVVLPFENWENSILGYHNSDQWKKGFLLNNSKISLHTEKLLKKYDVRPNLPNLKTANLSGGNQQKLVLAREINSLPKIFLIGQPTRGVDIGAIEYIHQHILDMRQAGVAIILVSVELDEIMSLSDQIIVMNNGQIVGKVLGKNADERKLGMLMAGINNDT